MTRPGRGSYLAVAGGSALGAVARDLVARGTLFLPGAAFPWGTLLVNVLGSFVIGGYATLTAPEGRWVVTREVRAFVMVGLCGGLTTFSIFSLETLLLVSEGRRVVAGGNLALAFLLWIPAAWAGHMIGVRLNGRSTDGTRHHADPST